MIPIQKYVENLDRLRVFWDGDAICIVLDDFVDLQQSPAVFIDSDSPLYSRLAPWVGTVNDPTIHLDHAKRCDIVKRLTE